MENTENKPIEDNQEVDELKDNFSSVDPSRDPEIVEDARKANNDYLLLPTDSVSKIMDAIEVIAKTVDPNDFKKHFSNNFRVGMAINSQTQTYQNGVFEKSLRDENNEFGNIVTYGDRKLYPAAVNFSTTNNNPKTNLAKFTKYINAGEVIRIPLWHSGFWITVRPPKQKDFIRLEEEIAANQIRLGRDTLSLVYSNYNVIVNRQLCNFIMEHVTETSLAINTDEEELLNYINVHDLNPIVLAIIASIFPKGLEYIKTCSNTLVMDGEAALCDNLVKAILDPAKLLFVNKRALSKKQLDHMAQMQAGSVSIESAKEYQRSIARLQSKKIKLKDDEITVELKLPSLSEYIFEGERWVGAIAREAQDLLDAGADETAKGKKMDALVSTLSIGLYNAYIKSISYQIGEGEVETITKTEQLESLIDKLSEVIEITQDFFEKIKLFIDESSIAIVATPAYTCPKCNKPETDNNSFRGGFNNLIPLNITRIFFALSGLNKKKYTNLAQAF